MNSSSVTCIRWVPKSDVLFVASFANGCMAFFHKEKDDQSGALSPPVENEPFKVMRQGKPIAETGGKQSKLNPVSYWQLSTAAVSQFEFNPEGSIIAAVGLDGCLRLIDYEQEILLDTFKSYYGGLTCVSWSSDGQYILVGSFER